MGLEPRTQQSGPTLQRRTRHFKFARTAGTPVDAVINLAGAPIADRPWTAARKQVLWSSRIDLTRTLVDWMRQQPQPPKVLLSGSAVGWYGDGAEALLDESSPAGAADFGSQLCIAWEQEAERANLFGVRVVLLRTAPVLAPKAACWRD